MAFMDTLVNAFVGSAQSKYTAIAILVAIAAVGLTVLFSKEKVPFGQKLVIVVLMFLLSLPAMLYALFQMTCLVTGAGGPGVKGKTWWCGVYAWVIAALVILYSVMVVVVSLLSLTADKETVAAETFYTKQNLYDTFAADEMSEEDKKKVEGGVSADEIMMMEEERPSEAFKVQTEMPAPVEAVPPMVSPMMGVDMVAPLVEKFTSCGAPLSPAPQMM